MELGFGMRGEMGEMRKSWRMVGWMDRGNVFQCSVYVD